MVRRVAVLVVTWLACALAVEDAAHDLASFEAAFQGRCGAGSPCSQLCRELHDGTYECGCRSGYLLNVDGYSCQEINVTIHAPEFTGEDVLYEKDAFFSAKLEVTSLGQEEIDREKTKEENADGDGQYVTTLGPSLEQKVPSETPAPQWTAAVDTTRCAGSCPCPLGRSGDHCEKVLLFVAVALFSYVASDVRTNGKCVCSRYSEPYKYSCIQNKTYKSYKNLYTTASECFSKCPFCDPKKHYSTTVLPDKSTPSLL